WKLLCPDGKISRQVSDGATWIIERNNPSISAHRAAVYFINGPSRGIRNDDDIMFVGRTKSNRKLCHPDGPVGHSFSLRRATEQLFRDGKEMVVDAVLQLVALPDHRQRDAIYLISGRHRAVVAPGPAGVVDATLVETLEPRAFFAASRFKSFKHAS